MTFKEFTKELNGKKVEGELIKTFFYSLITSVIIIAIAYFLFLRNNPDFIPKYSFYLFFAVLSYALIIPTFIHVKAYKEFLCMPGMMIGMSIGMVASFLSGFYIASTNGMFIGSIFGMTIGITFGIWNGRCCGIMGILEGIMAGFMGGLMGAMTAFMLLNDHLKASAVIVFLVSSLIIIGLHYMIYKETRENKEEHKKNHFFRSDLFS